MKIMALLKKDLKSLKWLLGIYYLFLLGQNAFLWTVFNTDGPNEITLTLYPLICLGLNAVATLFLALLTPLAIQEDPVGSDTAFWATRPVSPMELLAEKALFVALALIAPPIALEAINAVLGGGSPALVGAVALGALLSTLKCVAFFALAAALTRNLKSYLAVVGSVLLVWYGLLSAVELYLAVMTQSIYFEPVSMEVATECAIILLAIGLIIAFFRSRNRKWTAVAALIVFASLATVKTTLYHQGLLHDKSLDGVKELTSPSISGDLKQVNSEIEKISPRIFGRCPGTKPALVHYAEAARHYIPNLTVLNLPAPPNKIADGISLSLIGGVKYTKAKWHEKQTKAGKITNAVTFLKTKHIASPFEEFDFVPRLKSYEMELDAESPFTAPNGEQLLVNRKTGEALLTIPTPFGLDFLRPRFDLNSTPLIVDFKNAAGRELSLDQKWLDDAELASFDIKPVKCPTFPAGREPKTSP